jgi:putative redox protein
LSTQALWRADSGRSAASVTAPRGSFEVDLDAELGGRHPSPHDVVDAALAACTVLTLQLYAKRKQMALAEVAVDVSHEKSATGTTLHRTLRVHGELSDADRAALLRIAEVCPIHKMLTGSIEIRTALGP